MQFLDVDCQEVRGRRIIDDILQLYRRKIVISIAEWVVDVLLTCREHL